jgi:hypothetical protein
LAQQGPPRGRTERVVRGHAEFGHRDHLTGDVAVPGNPTAIGTRIQRHAGVSPPRSLARRTPARCVDQSMPDAMDQSEAATHRELYEQDTRHS